VAVQVGVEYGAHRFILKGSALHQKPHPPLALPFVGKSYTFLHQELAVKLAFFSFYKEITLANIRFIALPKVFICTAIRKI
jgi:hypothetical protein